MSKFYEYIKEEDGWWGYHPGYSRARAIEFTCDQCGKTDVRNKAEVVKHKHNFCNPECCYAYSRVHPKIGAANHRWGGGRFKDKFGYMVVRSYVGPRDGVASGGREEFEHRLVVEKSIGRKLTPEENVHHLNGVRDDNRLENLEIWNTKQPSGQRPEDKVRLAKEFLQLYRKGVS